jgi:hypothetical protein
MPVKVSGGSRSTAADTGAWRLHSALARHHLGFGRSLESKRLCADGGDCGSRAAPTVGSHLPCFPAGRGRSCSEEALGHTWVETRTQHLQRLGDSSRRARLLWSPTAHQTLWAAVTGAVRSPSGLDEDVQLTSFYGSNPLAPNKIRSLVGCSSVAAILRQQPHRFRVADDPS